MNETVALELGSLGEREGNNGESPRWVGDFVIGKGRVPVRNFHDALGQNHLFKETEGREGAKLEDQAPQFLTAMPVALLGPDEDPFGLSVSLSIGFRNRLVTFDQDGRVTTQAALPNSSLDNFGRIPNAMIRDGFVTTKKDTLGKPVDLGLVTHAFHFDLTVDPNMEGTSIPNSRSSVIAHHPLSREFVASLLSYDPDLIARINTKMISVYRDHGRFLTLSRILRQHHATNRFPEESEMQRKKLSIQVPQPHPEKDRHGIVVKTQADYRYSESLTHRERFAVSDEGKLYYGVEVYSRKGSPKLVYYPVGITGETKSGHYQVKVYASELKGSLDGVRLEVKEIDLTLLFKAKGEFTLPMSGGQSVTLDMLKSSEEMQHLGKGLIALEDQSKNMVLDEPPLLPMLDTKPVVPKELMGRVINFPAVMEVSESTIGSSVQAKLEALERDRLQMEAAGYVRIGREVTSSRKHSSTTYFYARQPSREERDEGLEKYLTKLVQRDLGRSDSLFRLSEVGVVPGSVTFYDGLRLEFRVEDIGEGGMMGRLIGRNGESINTFRKGLAKLFGIPDDKVVIHTPEKS